MKLRYYFDTEFDERQNHVELISIGIAAEDGREFYAISSEYNPFSANDWIKENVLRRLGAHLPKQDRALAPPIPRCSRDWIGQRIIDFIGDTEPVFWGYHADYDWVLFCWLFGTMMDLPFGWPRFCLDLKQEMVMLGVDKDKLPPQPSEEDRHNALVDARWNRAAHLALLSPPVDLVWERPSAAHFLNMLTRSARKGYG